MDLGDRKKSILRAIINNYIETAEPVGSRTIAKKYDMGLSSATIRNEMSDLEDLGFLEQPHTSAGRVPSDMAYRLYVNELMEINYPTNEEIRLIKNFLHIIAANEVEKIIKRTSKLLSDITKYTSLVITPSVKKSAVKSIQLVKVTLYDVVAIVVTDTGIIKNVVIKLPRPATGEILQKISKMLNEKLNNLTIEQIDLTVINSIQREMQGYNEILNAIIPVLYESLNATDCELYFDGAANIFNYPEYNDRDKTLNFFSMIEHKDLLLDLLSGNNDNLSISIGKENELEEVKDYSIVKTNYKIGDKSVGTIGIIGPTRMNYSRVIGILECLSDVLNNILKGYISE